MLDFLRTCWGKFREHVPLCNSVYPKMWLRHFSLEGLQFCLRQIKAEKLLSYIICKFWELYSLTTTVHKASYH